MPLFLSIESPRYIELSRSHRHSNEAAEDNAPVAVMLVRPALLRMQANQLRAITTMSIYHIQPQLVDQLLTPVQCHDKDIVILLRRAQRSTPR